MSRTAIATDNELTASTYETVSHAWAIDPEFHATVLSQYDERCPVSGIDHTELLDVVHILSWNDYPNRRADLSNVIPLSKTHHAAFDCKLFITDQEYRLQVSPSFETRSDLLHQTLINRAEERPTMPNNSIDPDYLRQHSAVLEWL